MRSRTGSCVHERHDEGPGHVSSRFLSELWQTLTRHGIPPIELLGDLPIAVDERGLVKAPVHWDHFNLFLRRLERRVGGAEGLERCGEWLGRRRTHAFSGVVALATSPLSLYRAAATWAAPRAMPGVVVELAPVSPNHLTLDVRVPDALGPCSPALHLTTGIYRTLPGLLGMPDAVVESRVEARRARYEITVPSSRTLIARLRRLLRSMLTPGTALRQLEDRQLELSARLTQLTRAHAALAASESRLRALSDATVDVLCELDANGRIVFVSASVSELMGYSPEQVVGSHYRLWIPSALHGLADARFEALRAAPVGTSVARQWIELHAAHGRRIGAEATIRSHAGGGGGWRAVASLRAVNEPARRRRALRSKPRHSTVPPRPLSPSPASIARPSMAPAAASPATAVPHASPLGGPAPARVAGPFAAPGTRDDPTTAGCLDRLRRGLTRIRQSQAGHPLERSLPELLSLLEAVERETSLQPADRLVDSTQRMTRIVEHALLGESGGAAPAQWHETRKLLERVRDGWTRRLEANEIELALDASRAPAELYGPEPVLEACLAGLLDWAIECSPARRGVAGVGRIELVFTKLPLGGRAEPGLRIMVVVAGTARADDPAWPGSAWSGGSLPGDAELALALAADAARALGGVLEEPLTLHEGDARAIRLPQPDPTEVAAFEPSPTVERDA